MICAHVAHQFFPNVLFELIAEYIDFCSSCHKRRHLFCFACQKNHVCLACQNLALCTICAEKHVKDDYDPPAELCNFPTCFNRVCSRCSIRVELDGVHFKFCLQEHVEACGICEEILLPKNTTAFFCHFCNARAICQNCAELSRRKNQDLRCTTCKPRKKRAHDRTLLVFQYKSRSKAINKIIHRMQETNGIFAPRSNAVRTSSARGIPLLSSN